MGKKLIVRRICLIQITTTHFFTSRLFRFPVLSCLFLVGVFTLSPYVLHTFCFFVFLCSSLFFSFLFYDVSSLQSTPLSDIWIIILFCSPLHSASLILSLTLSFFLSFLSLSSSSFFLSGIKGFYKGWCPALVQKIPSYALTWMFFQQIKLVKTRAQKLLKKFFAFLHRNYLFFRFFFSIFDSSLCFFSFY